MNSVKNIIKRDNLIQEGDVIGVGVSGGPDSMAMLHFLNKNKDKYKIDLFVINIDHGIREEGYKDSEFVKEYCKKNKIKHKIFKSDVMGLKEEMGWTIEQAAREARREVFSDMLRLKKVDKIFLAHHRSDQVETILLNLFRGTGLDGVSGMDIKSGNTYRPMLETSKQEVHEYILKNQIPYIVDESNIENEFSRNYLRNIVMPLIKKRWEHFDDNILKFSQIAESDNNYILKHTPKDLASREDYLVKIPLTYFVYEEPIVNRVIRGALAYLGATRNIEYKHIQMIRDMAQNLKNGSKLNLPGSIDVHREYDYITITSKYKQYYFEPFKLRSGKYDVRGFGKMEVRRTYDPRPDKGNHIVDISKVPASSMWRTRQEGDVFQKLGGGTKKLKDYMIDKKIPQRLRDKIPVLAYDSEVYIVAAYDISEKAKVDKTSKSGYYLKYKTDINK